MLSQWFKRKDKKNNKAGDEDGDEPEKSSGEFNSSSPKNSWERGTSPEPQAHKPAVLQKPFSKQLQQQQQKQSTTDTQDQQAVSSRQAESAPSLEEVKVGPEGTDNPVESGQRSLPSAAVSPSVSSSAHPESRPGSRGPRASPIERTPSSQAKQQSSGNLSTTTSGSATPQSEMLRPKLDTHHYHQYGQQYSDESPVDVSPLITPGSGLTEDSSSRSPSTDSPASPAGDNKAENFGGVGGVETPVSTGEDTTGEISSTWSDSCLRSYLDDGSDVRDLFIIVHDKSNVAPAGPDHPISGSLFREERKRLEEMTGQLDAMLTDWMTGRARKEISKT